MASMLVLSVVGAVTLNVALVASVSQTVLAYAGTIVSQCGVPVVEQFRAHESVAIDNPSGEHVTADFMSLLHVACPGVQTLHFAAVALQPWAHGCTSTPSPAALHTFALVLSALHPTNSPAVHGHDGPLVHLPKLHVLPEAQSESMLHDTEQLFGTLASGFDDDTLPQPIIVSAATMTITFGIHLS